MASGHWVYKLVNGRMTKVWVGDKPKTTPHHHHASSPSSSSSSGGGGSTATKTKTTAYIDAIAQIYRGSKKGANLTAWEKAQVNKFAAAGRSVADFIDLVRKMDPRYMTSLEAQSALATNTATLSSLFPGQDLKTLQKLLNTSVRMGWNADLLQQKIQGTALWKQYYPEYAVSGLNPQTYQAYTQAFNNAMAQYGLPVNPDFTHALFSSHVTPQDFAQNLDTLAQGSGSFNWATGQDLTTTQQNAELLGVPQSTYTAQAFGGTKPNAPTKPVPPNGNTNSPSYKRQMAQYKVDLKAYNTSIGTYNTQAAAWNTNQQAQVAAAPHIAPNDVRSKLQQAFATQKDFQAAQGSKFGLNKNNFGTMTQEGI